MSDAITVLGDAIVNELQSSNLALAVKTIERRNTWEIETEVDLSPGRRIVVSPAQVAFITDTRSHFRPRLRFAVTLAESIDGGTLDERESRVDQLNKVLLEIASHLSNQENRQLAGFSLVAIGDSQNQELFDPDMLRSGVYFARHVYTYE